MEQKVMSYKQLIENVSRSSGIDRKIVRVVIDATTRSIVKGALLGRTVQVNGFGAFRLKFLGRRSITYLGERQ